MDNLEQSLISLESEILPVAPLDDKPSETESASDLNISVDEKMEETDKTDTIVLAESEETASDLDKTTVSIEEDKEAADAVNVEELPVQIDTAKSNLSEFLKVGDDPPQSAVVLNEFEEGLESARDKIIEDLMSATETTAKDELFFDVLNTESSKVAENKDANTEEISMEIDTSLKNDEPETAKAAEIVAELNVEDKIEELLNAKDDDVSAPNIEVNDTLEATTIENDGATKNGIDKDKLSLDTSKDDIDTLLSTLMPDLESSTKPDDISTIKKTSGAPSIQYLREVLDKPEERGVKRRKSSDSETDESAPKKPKVYTNLPEVTLIKFTPKKKRMNFDDLMSNLTKIKLPSSSWKVRISAGSNPFSIVEFHEKEKLLRSVKFFKDDFHYTISFNNLPVELLGAPHHVHSLDDVSVLLSIVNTLINNDPVVHYI